MKIIEYDSIYDEQIKDLLVELQNYLIDIDNWHTPVMIPEYKENIFIKNDYIIRDTIVSKRL